MGRVVTAGCFMKKRNEEKKRKKKTDYTRFTTVRTRAVRVFLSRDFFLRLG